MSTMQREIDHLVAELEKAAANPTVRFAGFGEVLQQLGRHVRTQAGLVMDLQRRVAELERRR